jgi:hypothetical protein
VTRLSDINLSFAIFRYTNLVVRDGSGIRQDHPQDLKGKHIPDYQMSMALWTRGILQPVIVADESVIGL